MLRPEALRLTAVILLLSLQGCVFVPRTVEVYNSDCQVMSRKMEMQPSQIAGIYGCSNADCAAFLVVAGATAAASAVVSGSIVVVGNVIYWLEKQGRCTRAG